MKITKVQIDNYRNLSGLSIYFDENYNFIVGENNIGKSNILWLLNSMFSFRAFNGEDFHDKDKEIKIKFQLKLDQVELGNFEDLFDSENPEFINLIAIQENVDENIAFYHEETNTSIPASEIKSINFIHYDSLRNPITEISFDKGRGVGRFLRQIVSRYLEVNSISDTDFIEQKNIIKLLDAINEKISKVKPMRDFNIAAVPDDDVESLLLKLITLKDSKGENLSKAGYGVQFLILVTLSILEQIQFISQHRKDRAVFEHAETHEKAISLVVGLDEPEIHLHPYMQRALVKYLNEVINNKNEDFQALIKELFDIDKFIGQIIIATHSPNILLKDYHQVLRLCIENEKLEAKCGTQLQLPKNIEKHLYLHFPFIKEAFFSKCVIFVEGDSEFASFPELGEKLFEDFDELGIGVIQANGQAVPQLIEIANSFGIPSIGITDRDDKKTSPTNLNHYLTDRRDFEEELINNLLTLGKEETLRTIINEYDPLGEKRSLQPNTLNKHAKKRYKIVEHDFEDNLQLSNIENEDITNLKAFYLTWFSINKSFPLGKLIGETLPAEQIPSILNTVLAEAHKLAKNA